MKLNSDLNAEKPSKGNREKGAHNVILEAEARVIRARALLAQRGYRLMHRRNGQYWVMIDSPMTLDQIEASIERRTAQ
jgi:hypothetical protein